MKNNPNEPPSGGATSQCPEAKAYLEKNGVVPDEFPSEKLERLQYLLTTESDAGCRTYPDPNWNPRECQEASDEFFQELEELREYIGAFRQGGRTLAEAQAKLAPKAVGKPQPQEGSLADFLREAAKFASNDHRTATERGLDWYRSQFPNEGGKE